MDKPSPHTASTITPSLLARVAKGEQQAFSQLYDHSSTRLFTLAVKVLGNREEAAALLQDIYGEIWRNQSRYDVGRGTPIAWLVTLTRGRAIDRLRARAAQGHQAATALNEAPAKAANQTPNPVETEADQALHLAVSEALAGLPPGQQQALDLAYYEGLSLTEIAVRLNQPLDTVKSHIMLGMAQLRDELQEWWNQDQLP
ncbi:MAG: sigma-70 family RNA polymerase sigma factor [Nitrospirae bacterium]|nr:sigma-70 family RNA polymerase sigma factor [Nitrospirota bacterium]